MSVHRNLRRTGSGHLQHANQPRMRLADCSLCYLACNWKTFMQWSGLMADVSAGFWWANRGTQRLNYSLALFSSRQRRFDSHERSFLQLRFSHELVLLAQLSKLFHVLAGASSTKASNFWLKPLAARRAHSERCMPGLAVVVKERVLTQIPCVIVCSSRSLYMFLHDNLRW